MYVSLAYYRVICLLLHKEKKMTVQSPRNTINDYSAYQFRSFLLPYRRFFLLVCENEIDSVSSEVCVVAMVALVPSFFSPQLRRPCEFVPVPFRLTCSRSEHRRFEKISPSLTFLPSPLCCSLTAVGFQWLSPLFKKAILGTRIVVSLPSILPLHPPPFTPHTHFAMVTTFRQTQKFHPRRYLHHPFETSINSLSTSSCTSTFNK